MPASQGVYLLELGACAVNVVSQHTFVIMPRLQVEDGEDFLIADAGVPTTRYHTLKRLPGSDCKAN